jgi:hypothetical protein
MVALHWSDEQAKAAEARGKTLLLSEPQATSARFDPKSGQIIAELSNGCTFAFPARRVQGLENATDADLAAVLIAGAGFGFHWEKQDVDIALCGLMGGTFGTKAWMAELGRAAGRSRSPAKAAAARANGAKGGRPRVRVG